MPDKQQREYAPTARTRRRRFVTHFAAEVLLLAVAMVSVQLATKSVEPSVGACVRTVLALLGYWRMCSLEVERIRFVFSDFGRLKVIINSDLFSGSRWRQRRAIRYLSLLAGRRFGNAWAGKRSFTQTIGLWREWWRANASAIVWIPEIAMYVEERYVAILGRAECVTNDNQTRIDLQGS